MADLIPKEFVPPIASVMNKRWLLLVAIPFLLILCAVFICAGGLIGFERLVDVTATTTDQKAAGIIFGVAICTVLYAIADSKTVRYGFLHAEQNQLERASLKASYDCLLELPVTHDGEDSLGTLLLFQRLSLATWLLWLVWNPLACGRWCFQGGDLSLWLFIVPGACAIILITQVPSMEPMALWCFMGPDANSDKSLDTFCRVILWIVFFWIGWSLRSIFQLPHTDSVRYVQWVVLIENIMFLAVIISWSRTTMFYITRHRTGVGQPLDYEI